MIEIYEASICYKRKHGCMRLYINLTGYVNHKITVLPITRV